MADRQTVNVAVTFNTNKAVDPKAVERLVASAVSLIEIEEDPNATAIVRLDQAPSDADGPFTVHEQQPGGAYSDEPDATHPTWIGAMAAAQSLENSGIFVEVRDGAGETAYSSEG